MNTAISGTMTAYAGGGGGGSYFGTNSGNPVQYGAPGGVGGGGAGGLTAGSNGTPGTVNRGGGGGGGTRSSGNASGGAGGSGIIIIRYITNQIDVEQQGTENLMSTVTATGSATTTDNAYAYHVWTSSGTFATTKQMDAEVFLVGGGGGGGGASNGHAGGGGGGGVVRRVITFATGETYNVSIGAGGTAGSGWPSPGSDGANTGITINGEPSNSNVF